MMFWRHVIKPWLYDLTDHSRKPRLISLYVGFATAILFFLIVSIAIFWNTIGGWIYVILVPTFLLGISLVLYVTVPVMIRTVRNIPYWIEVRQTEAEVNKVEIIEFIPATEEVIPWKQVWWMVAGLYACILIGLGLTWNTEFLYWTIVVFGILMAQVIWNEVRRAKNTPKPENDNFSTVIKTIGWQYAIWSATVVCAFMDGTTYKWILLVIALVSMGVAYNKTFRRTRPSESV